MAESNNLSEDRENKGFLQSLFRNNDKRLTLIDQSQDSRFKSKVWESFRLVCLDNIKVNFVVCGTCNEFIPYKNGNTSSLIKHKCKSSSSSVQLTLDSFKKSSVPQSQVDDLNMTITIGLAKDMRPLSTVEREGFMLIAQKLITFGATNGFQNAKDVLQSRKTLKDKHLSSIYVEQKENLKELINQSASFPNFAFTMDMWSDCYQHKNYLSFSIHFLDANWKLKTQLLAVNEFPELPKTTDNIRQECTTILEDYFGDKTEEIMNKAYCVTDGGSNMVKVFSNRLPCFCHRLNLLVTWIFYDRKKDKKWNENNASEKKQFSFSESCPSLEASIEAVKNTVTYFKQSSLNSRLQFTLKQEVPTRWNSKLIMLKSYIKAKSQVKQIMLEKNQLSRIISINDNALEELIAFLQLFLECTERWSQEKKPTIHEIVLWIFKLRKHIQENEKDSTELKALKRQAAICLTEYFDVDNFFFIACVFNPRYKKLKFVPTDKRDQVYLELREMIDAAIIDCEGDTNTDAAKSSPLPKKSRFDFLLGESSDSEDENTSSNKHELDAYLETRTRKEEKQDDFYVLQYWKSNSTFPRMRSIASWMLAIPASQTTDERIFSCTGNTISPKRTDLKGSTLSALTFVNKNYGTFE